LFRLSIWDNRFNKKYKSVSISFVPAHFKMKFLMQYIQLFATISSICLALDLKL
jgi:hypothetical protein